MCCLMVRPLDLGFWIQTLARVIVLCSWAGQITLRASASLCPGEEKDNDKLSGRPNKMPWGGGGGGANCGRQLDWRPIQGE